MTETQEIMESIISIIQKGRSFLILGHKNVDGDAYGSSMALYFFLLNLKKYVEVVNELPITPLFSFLNVHKLVKNEIKEKRFDAIFICDCGELSLIGTPLKIYSDIFKNTTIINIDHHTGNKNFGTYNLIDTKASSTCELIYNLLKKFGTQFSKQISTLLLFGIIRDTNCFKNSISPHTFEITGKLLALGAEYEKIIFHTYKSEKLNYLQLSGHILENLISLRGSTIVGGIISQETFKKYGIRENELGPQFINEILSSIDSVDFVFLIKEMESGENKLSLRARSEGFNVSLLASYFGGGGHKKSAGAYTKASTEEILRVIETMDIKR